MSIAAAARYDTAMTRQLVLDEFVPYRLSYASNLVSDAIAGAYEALFGLSIPEWRIVAVTAEVPAGVTQAAIVGATRMDKVTVSRAAAALVARGLLVRRDNPNDRRSHLLVPSAAGRTLYATVAPKALELEARILADFAPAERAALMAMLRRIETAAAALDGAGNSSRD